MCSGSEAGSYLRLIDFFVSLNSRLESNKEEEKKNGPAMEETERKGAPNLNHDP